MTTASRALPPIDEQPQQSTPPGFAYIAEFLSAAAQHTLLQEVEALSYRHDTFRGQLLKRSNATFGWDYVAVGRQLRPAPAFPTFLVTLIDQALPYCPPGTHVDMCLIQRYPKDAGIGWHIDAPAFGDVIFGVSLGAPGRLQFRPKGSTRVTFEQAVAPGALYVMHGPARRDFQHQVPPVKDLRYSLTFRKVNDVGEQ